MSQVPLGNIASREGNYPILETHDVSVIFRRSKPLFRRALFDTEIRAVNRVSFSVGESEIVSLVGESGSGKTTLARCIAGLVPATAGSIKFNGKEIATFNKALMKEYWKNVQMIYQDPFESLDPGKDVYSIISTPIRNLTEERDPNVIRQIVQDLLVEMDLDPAEVMLKFPHQLSGGQRQRVNIARALAPNPKLLLADEPITMLDAAQRLNILALLKRLQATRKLSILLITHDLASAKVMSQRTFVMYLGKLVEYGPTERVLGNPHHPYVELIMKSTPKLTKVPSKAEDVKYSWIEQSEKVKSGCVFEPRCKYATELCRSEEPVLAEISPLHYAACHNFLNAEKRE
ncbi:MAG: ABC transporter ATP-binding protein [Nitrososphaerota archaeon]|nr:ABC transporter ATP-binding protein [Nitrososphaerota archaeon]